MLTSENFPDLLHEFLGMKQSLVKAGLEEHWKTAADIQVLVPKILSCEPNEKIVSLKEWNDLCNLQWAELANKILEKIRSQTPGAVSGDECFRISSEHQPDIRWAPSHLRQKHFIWWEKLDETAQDIWRDRQLSERSLDTFGFLGVKSLWTDSPVNPKIPVYDGSMSPENYGTLVESIILANLELVHSEESGWFSPDRKELTRPAFACKQYPLFWGVPDLILQNAYTARRIVVDIKTFTGAHTSGSPTLGIPYLLQRGGQLILDPKSHIYQQLQVYFAINNKTDGLLFVYHATARKSLLLDVVFDANFVDDLQRRLAETYLQKLFPRMLFSSLGLDMPKDPKKSKDFDISLTCIDTKLVKYRSCYSTYK